MKLANLSDYDILAIATPIMDNLMDASTAINYERHVRDFTERARNALPLDLFECVCAEYQQDKGFFSRREFVALFRRPNSVALVWRQEFTKSSGEYLAEMILVQHGDKYLVDHVMVL